MSKRKKGSHSEVARVYARSHVHPKDDINLLKGGLKNR